MEEKKEKKRFLGIAVRAETVFLLVRNADYRRVRRGNRECESLERE